jgi:polysaccharide chain length determinant protein (PEP-CTERM system associated)
MQDHIRRALEEVRGAWRFRWSALAGVWVVCIVGWLVVLVLPNRFEATARVFVDPTTALRPVIQGLAVEQDVDAEINLVRQSLLSEVELGKIIAATGLDAKVRSPPDGARVLRELRDRIEISVQAAGAGGDRAQLSKMYTIAYRDSKRERSLKVVQMLLDHLVEGTLGGKREGSQQAQDFLRQQIQEYEGRLSAAEARLAEFKKKNVGMVPGEQPGMDYFARLQAEMDAVKRSQTAVNAAAMRRDTLHQQLRGEGSVAASVRTSGAAPGVGGAGGEAARLGAAGGEAAGGEEGCMTRSDLFWMGHAREAAALCATSPSLA